jgi:hypothetical protein
MDPQVKRSLLWGLVGGLSFLVLLQGYEIATDRLVDWSVKLGVAAVVCVGSAGLTYVAARRQATRNEQT